jgi:streptogramin lyase
MVFDPETGGQAKNYNRMVIAEQGQTETFYMDSSTTTLNKSIFLTGSPSSSQLVDVKIPAYPRGLGIENNDSIWVGNDYPSRIFKLSQSGDLDPGIESPTNDLRGVGVDNNDCIWCAGSSSIYQLNQSGNVDSKIPAPGYNNYPTGSEPRGVGVDSSNCIWHADSSDEEVFELDQSGTILSSFSTPGSDPIGLGVDSNDSIWLANGFPTSIYKLNQSGTVLTQLDFTGSPNGLDLDSNDCIWISDSNSENVARFDQSLNLEYSYELGSKVNNRTNSTIELKDNLKGLNLFVDVLDSNVEKAKLEFYSQPDDGGSIGGGPGGG